MPWPSFDESARALDKQRLQKQIVEAYQVVRCGTGAVKAWRSHPAVTMWALHLEALTRYAAACTESYNKRGGSGQLVITLANRELDRFHREQPDDAKSQLLGPPWAVGFAPFHVSHQLNLVRKQPGWYLKSLMLDGVVAHSVAMAEPYLWPRDDGTLQVGPKGTGRPWHSAFGGTLLPDGTLLVTANEAIRRYERDFPKLMDRLAPA